MNNPYLIPIVTLQFVALMIALSSSSYINNQRAKEGQIQLMLLHQKQEEWFLKANKQLDQAINDVRQLRLEIEERGLVKPITIEKPNGTR